MPDSQGNLVPGDAGYSPTPTGGVNPPVVTGLVNTPPPAQATPSTPTAVPFTVAPNATVASNVKSIVDADSPLMQQAATRAAGQANARGLLNSSQAVGAGQAALYDAALPIAQADAATNARAGEQTTLAQNAAETQRANIVTSTSQFNAGATNAQTLQNIQSNTQLSVTDKQAEAQKLISAADNVARDKIAKLQADTTLSQTQKQIASNEILAQRDNDTKQAMQVYQLNADLQKINTDGTIRQSLAQTEATYKVLMQTSAGAADLYKQSLTNFAAIITNPDVPDKAGALNQALLLLNDGLKLIGNVSNLNLGTYLTFDPAVISPPPPPPPVYAGGAPSGASTTSSDGGGSGDGGSGGSGGSGSSGSSGDGE